MFDDRTLDHRTYGSKTPIEALQSGMRIGFAERDKAVKEAMDGLKDKVRSLLEILWSRRLVAGR